MIDLTQPIKVEPIIGSVRNFDTKRHNVIGFEIRPKTGDVWWINEGLQEGLRQTEEYRRLFEKAPGLYKLARLIANVSVEDPEFLNLMRGLVLGAKGAVASIEIGEGPWDEAAFERLFEPARRMKVEHGKMLALLKNMAQAEGYEYLKSDGLKPPYWWPAHDVWTLIAEIEKPKD